MEYKNNKNLIILILCVIILYMLLKYKNKIKKWFPRKIVYDATCSNCSAWNHRDARPHCEKTCLDKFGKDWKYNLQWKHSENKNDIVCGCVKI